MDELYDERYKWLKTERIDITICKCPKCGYENEARIINDLVPGHYLAPYCPNCGEKMTEDETDNHFAQLEYGGTFIKPDIFLT